LTVGELKAVLESLNPEMLVVLSSDVEGNGYSPLDAYGLGDYCPESTWSGEFYTNDDPGLDLDVFEEDTNCRRAVALWPVN
jgi:hypothetical protein